MLAHLYSLFLADGLGAEDSQVKYGLAVPIR
jgi:hypothetical protein